jgi:hypothetical protein
MAATVTAKMINGAVFTRTPTLAKWPDDQTLPRAGGPRNGVKAVGGDAARRERSARVSSPSAVRTPTARPHQHASHAGNAESILPLDSSRPTSALVRLPALPSGTTRGV